MQEDEFNLKMNEIANRVGFCQIVPSKRDKKRTNASDVEIKIIFKFYKTLFAFNVQSGCP